MRTAVFLGILCLAAACWGQGAKRVTEKDSDEILWLDRMSLPENWYPVEECTAQGFEVEAPQAGPGLLLHFGIDHHGGEKAYPVGWPRAHFVPKGWERDWEAWDRFEFEVLVTSSRDRLPGRPLTLELGEERPTFNPALAFAPLGEWATVSVPTADIRAAGGAIVGDMPRIRFVVSESEYADRDIVDFHFKGFRLVRSLECVVTEMEALTPVVFAGQPAVRLALTVAGPPESVKRGVPFSLRRGDRPVRSEMLPLGRGKQIYDCDISELALSPGDYVLTVFEGDAAKRKSVSLRVVSDPWKEE